MSTYQASHFSYDLGRIVDQFMHDEDQLHEVEEILQRQLGKVDARLKQLQRGESEAKAPG